MSLEGGCSLLCFVLYVIWAQLVVVWLAAKHDVSYCRRCTVLGVSETLAHDICISTVFDCQCAIVHSHVHVTFHLGLVISCVFKHMPA